MALTYHYAFKAPPATPASELERFLKSVEVSAKQLGFDPTSVVNAEFLTAEQRKFARLLTTGLEIQDERLKGVTLLDERQVWNYDPVNGSVRLIPQMGVVLVVTDTWGTETVFGFLRYPRQLFDVNSRLVLHDAGPDQWTFRGFVTSPDQRFRKIVRCFADAGLLDMEKDEFV